MSDVIKKLDNLRRFLLNFDEKFFSEAVNKKAYAADLEDAINLLKERGEIKPYIDIDEAKCPICKVKLTRQELLGEDVLFEDFFDYCPHCGRSVKW